MSANFSELESVDIQLNNFEKIKVPVYQRSYSWELEFVEVFWNDILESINDEREKYFIGPIITKNIGEKHVELIDGQQRITTSLALLSIIRRFFLFEKIDSNTEGLDKHYNSLSKRFVNEDTILSDDGEPIYEMNAENSPVFVDYILKDIRLDDIKRAQSAYKKQDSNYKLLDALIYFWGKVDDYCGNKFDSVKLRELAAFVLGKLHVLNIRVSDEADAFLIFETINDRGRALDTLDLVKNLLFSQAKKSHFDLVKSNWIKMMAFLGTLNNYSDFLNQYWITRQGNYVKSNLFKLIREFIKDDKSNVYEFSKSITEASRVYSAISNLEDDFWNSYPKSAIKNMATLKMLGAKAINPTIMAASKSFDADEFSKLLKYLVVFQVRYVLISEQHTNKYSNAMAQIPPLIVSGKLNKAMKVARKLKELGVYVSDDIFKSSFNSFVAPSTKKAKYLLSEIEHYVSGRDKVVNEDSKEINVEHIMPQVPGEGWRKEVTQVNSDEYDTFCNMLGNLCLTNSKLNKDAKNLSFDLKKQKLFEKSKEIKTTECIKDYESWNKETIKLRQEDLSEKVHEIWGIAFD